MHTLRDYLIRVRTLCPEDSLATAAEAVRNSRVGATPVIEFGRPVGLITAQVVARFLAGRDPQAASRAQVADVVPETWVALPEDLSPAKALLFIQANRLERAPVVDPDGRFLGMVSAADLACVACGRERPGLIGGMATPFGVYLTGGGVRGGVGDLALMTTGLMMAAIMMVSFRLTEWVLTHPVWVKVLPLLAGWLQHPSAAELLSMVLFGGLFRLTWVTGYHAAEHQVVHAIEAGDDLDLDAVRRQPRVHPRCGTNLVAAVLIMSLFWRNRVLDDAQPLIAMLTTLFLWRRVGSWIQQHVTTRPATVTQIDSGIRAARELLTRYQQGPRPSQTFARRIWNMGMLQVFAGSLLLFGALALMQAIAPVPEFLKVY